MERKWGLAAIFAVAVALTAVPAGLAASPQQVYRDLADNGRLDGHYSKRDLSAALSNLSVQGYGSKTATSGLKAALAGKSSPPSPPSPPASPQASQLNATVHSGALPFTGLDLGLFAVGAGILLMLGTGLRRFAREQR